MVLCLPAAAYSGHASATTISEPGSIATGPVEPRSALGAAKNLDNTVGFGPENYIGVEGQTTRYTNGTAADSLYGDYKVRVNYFADHDSNIHGAAFYYDDYVKTADGWRIKATGYRRIYEEMYPRTAIDGLALVSDWFTNEP